ncbi:MAG: 2-keto-3-deoxygluconate kinase, partial [Desulfobacterales bacterium CG23_combo_of_CG06-09_8_20_14_all_51_8]
DPIGAGDYFGAAFTYSLLQKWSLQKVSDFANAFAALCISREKGKGLP